MAQYIDKDALVAEIEGLKSIQLSIFSKGESIGRCYDSLTYISVYNEILSLLNTLEVKEVGADIPNIDDLLEEDGIDPDSREAKIFKESYYSALEKLKEKIV